MNEHDIKELPEYEGIAHDMGDFFYPDDCKDKILVRQGMMKSGNDRVWYLMAATKMTGSLNLVSYKKNSKFDDKWEWSTLMSNGQFQNLIEQKYNIKLK